MKQYDLEFIACGARNSVYARNLRRQYGDQIHLSAVCDANPQTAEEFKQAFGQPDTVIYTDFREMITKHRESLDGVLIAPPNHLHEEPAVMAFENNIHTLLEKPVAHSPRVVYANCASLRQECFPGDDGFCVALYALLPDSDPDGARRKSGPDQVPGRG